MIRKPEREYTDFAAGLKFVWHLDRDGVVQLLGYRAESLQLEVDQVDAVITMLKNSSTCAGSRTWSWSTRRR